MKKIVLCILLLCTGDFLYAQMIENGNFDINGGNDISTGYCMTCATCPTSGILSPTPGFSNSSIPNWIRTHGSPNFGGNPDVAGFPLFPGSIFLTDMDRVGEGMAGGYPFLEGETYDIHVGVDDIQLPAKIRIVVGKNPRPFSDDCSILCGSPTQVGAINPFPVTIPSSSTLFQEVPHATLNVGDNHIVFTSNNYFDWIAIFPDANAICFASSNVTLRYFWVTGRCKGDIHFPPDILPLSSNPIIPTFFTGYQNIFAGSVYGSSPAVPVSIDPGSITTFEAVKSINLGDIFEATAGNGYFLAHIKEDCGSLPPEVVSDIESYNCGPLTGPNSFCQGSSSAYSCTSVGVPCSPGGTWASSNTSVVTISPSGVAHGVSPGTSTITFSRPPCLLSKVITVYPVAHCAKPEPSIEVAQGEDVELFPNPVQGNLTIAFYCRTQGKLQIIVRDVAGRERYSKHFTCNEGERMEQIIDLNNVAPGVYMTELRFDERHVVKKFVKM